MCGVVTTVRILIEQSLSSVHLAQIAAARSKACKACCNGQRAQLPVWLNCACQRPVAR